MLYAGHATEDTFVRMSHSERLHNAYGGVDKELLTFAGDHNSLRSNKFYTAVVVFFHRALLCEDPETAEALEKFRQDLLLWAATCMSMTGIAE